jgi:hypothetical protein
MICIGKLKSGKNCRNPSKYGDYCGVHNNVKKREETIKAPKSLLKLKPSEIRREKNIEKMNKLVHEMNKNILKAKRKELEKPTRRRST